MVRARWLMVALGLGFAGCAAPTGTDVGAGPDAVRIELLADVAVIGAFTEVRLVNRSAVGYDFGTCDSQVDARRAGRWEAIAAPGGACVVPTPRCDVGDAPCPAPEPTRLEPHQTRNVRLLVPREAPPGTYRFVLRLTPDGAGGRDTQARSNDFRAVYAALGVASASLPPD